MGKRALMRAHAALEPRPGRPRLRLAWHRLPFRLRPERVGLEKWHGVLTRLGASRGDPSWVTRFVPSMKARGAELGIRFDFGGDVGNSLMSLRLLRWCQDTHGLVAAEALADRLAEQHFEQKLSVGSPEALIQAAVAVGLDAGDARRVCVDDPSIARDAVLRDMDMLAAQGVTSIPLFIFEMASADGGPGSASSGSASSGSASYVVQGAGSQAEFSRVLEQIQDAATVKR